MILLIEAISTARGLRKLTCARSAKNPMPSDVDDDSGTHLV